MTDILDLHDSTEPTFDLEIVGRKDGKPVKTGVTFKVRDLGNTDTQVELKKVNASFMGRRLKSGEDLSDEDTGRMFFISTNDPTDEMLAHCVTDWDFAGNTLGKYKTEFSYKNVLAVISGLPWIREQVLQKVLSIRDFTKA